MSETSFNLLLILLIVGLMVIAVIVSAMAGFLHRSPEPSVQDSSLEHDYNANLGENENEYREAIRVSWRVNIDEGVDESKHQEDVERSSQDDDSDSRE